MGKIQTVTTYKCTDGSIHETESSAKSRQRVIDWQESFTEVPFAVWDPDCTITLKELCVTITKLMNEHGPEADLQLRSDEDSDMVTAYVRSKQL